MPTVMRIGRYRLVIFLNDHSPAHVHVVSGEGRAKIDLPGTDQAPMLVEVEAIGKADMRRIMAKVSEQQEYLIARWRELHG